MSIEKDAAELRVRAEAQALETVAQFPKDLGSEEGLAVLQELRVHQIELEMQNEELRRTQADLAAARARYFDLYDLAPSGYLTLGPKGQILEANLAAGLLLGLDRRSLGVQFFSRFILDDDQDLHYMRQKELSKTGMPSAFEIRLAREDGTAFWAHLRERAAEDEDGKQVFHLILNDISDRKRIEETLKESEARFRSIADAAPVMLWQSGTDAQCDYFNKPWLDFTGRSMGQEVGEGWTAGIFPADRQACLDTYMAAFNARRDFSMEYRLRRADGEHRWLADNGIPRFTPEGDFLGYIGACLDITDRKRSAAELEAAYKENKGLLSELQHRVKNSFSMICSMINLASTDDASPDTKAILAQLDIRVRSVSALYSQLYASGSMTEVRLDDYFARITDTLEGLAPNISVPTEMECIIVPVSHAAPIGLILTELVTNSIKYAFPGARIGIVAVSLKRVGPDAILEVRDDGVGLPAGFDLSASSGMGLHLVQGLTGQIKGSFSMTGGPTGTCCRVSFPVD